MLIRFAIPVVVVLSVACTGQHVTEPTWQETGRTADRPHSADRVAASDFGAAVALYADGRYPEALEAFRLFGAEHPGDVMAVHAEIHGARVLAAMGNTLEAEAAFRSLQAAPDGPETWAAASLYLAFVGALRGESAWALAVLTDALAVDPGLRVPRGWVVPGDEALLGALLAEARIESGTPLEALPDLALVASAGEGAIVEYATDRAIEAGELVPDRRALQATFDAGDPFAQAAIAPALARACRLAGDADAAREVLLRAELPATVWGRPERLVEEAELLAAEGSDTPIRYGAALSLTGPTRRAGRAALGAILLAQRAFEDRPALSTVLIRDTQGTADGTRRAVEALASEGVSVIVGPIETDLADEARRAAVRAGVPLVALSPAAFERSEPDTFRWLIDPAVEARTALAEAERRGVDTWVLVVEPVVDAAPFFASFAAAAAARVDGSGGVIRDRLTFGRDVDDATRTQEAARDVARAIAATDATGVILALPDDLAATLAAYLASEDIWPSSDGSVRSSSGRRQVTYVASSFAISEALLRNSATYFEGAIIPFWFDPELATGTAREFADRFAFTYGRAPGTVEAFAFDAATGVRRILIDEGITAPDHVAARLRAGVETGGAVGPLRFGPDGNPAVEPRLCTVRGGRFVLP